MGEIGTIAMSGAVVKGDNDRAIADYSKAFGDIIRGAQASVSTPGDWPSTTRGLTIADFTKVTRGEPEDRRGAMHCVYVRCQTPRLRHFHLCDLTGADNAADIYQHPKSKNPARLFHYFHLVELKALLAPR